MGFRPHRSPRQIRYEFRKDARFGLRRRRNLRQLHRARAIPSSGPSGFPRGLLFSFNVNPGYDGILQEYVPDSCYDSSLCAPASDPPIDFDRFDHRERAAELSAGRIRDSLAAPLTTGKQRNLITHQDFFSHIREFVQRMARGPRLRADEGRGYTHGCRAATRLPQPSLR